MIRAVGVKKQKKNANKQINKSTGFHEVTGKIAVQNMTVIRFLHECTVLTPSRLAFMGQN